MNESMTNFLENLNGNMEKTIIYDGEWKEDW